MAARSGRISSATLGKKAHFCDRHHIAGAPSALVSHSSGTACAVLTFDGFLPNSAPPTRGFFAFLGRRSGHSGRRRYHPTTAWGMGGMGDGGGWFMSNVLSLQLGRERARQPEGGSNGHASKRLAWPLWNSEITRLNGRRSLERLEAENAQLRRSVVELVLQIQALRDGAGTLSAYDAARHRRNVP